METVAMGAVAMGVIVTEMIQRAVATEINHTLIKTIITT
jgi:hypothetical protein